VGLILLQPRVSFKCKGYRTWRWKEEFFAFLLKERQTYVQGCALEAESCQQVKEKGFLLSLDKWGVSEGKCFTAVKKGNGYTMIQK